MPDARSDEQRDPDLLSLPELDVGAQDASGVPVAGQRDADVLVAADFRGEEEVG